MKKVFPIVLVLLIFAGRLAADTVYLKNGQFFQADLIRMTDETLVVRYAGVAEIDFELSTIDRVEDQAGKVIFRNEGVQDRRRPDVIHSREVEDAQVTGEAVQAPEVPVTWPAEAEDGDVPNGGVPGSGPPTPSPSVDEPVGITHTLEPGPILPPQDNSAAFDKGSLSFGGLISFSSIGGDVNENVYGIPNDRRLNLFSISPNAMYFLFDRLGIGLDGAYRREQLTDHSGDQLALGPRVLFALPVQTVVRPYVDVGVGVVHWRFSADSGAYSTVGMTVKTGGGAYYFVNDRYAVNMEMTFEWDRFSPDLEVYPITGNALVFSVGLSGFIY